MTFERANKDLPPFSWLPARRSRSGGLALDTDRAVHAIVGLVIILNVFLLIAILIGQVAS